MPRHHLLQRADQARAERTGDLRHDLVVFAGLLRAVGVPVAPASSAQAMRALGFVNAPATAQRALLHLDSWEINAVPYRERRVLLTPGVAFGVPSHLRLCFSVPRPKLKMAMDALSDLAAAGQPAE